MVRQFLAVQLSCRRCVDWQCIDDAERGRDGVGWQMVLQELAHGSCRRGIVPLGWHNVRHQLLVGAFIAHGQDDGAAQFWMLGKRGFDSTKDDRISADLDHEIASSQYLELAVGQQTTQIAGAVESWVLPLAVIVDSNFERVGNKALLGLLGQVQVPTTNDWAADVHLALSSVLHQFHGAAVAFHVDDVELDAGNLVAARCVLAIEIQLASQVADGHVVAFRNGVQVHEFHVWQQLGKGDGQLSRDDLAAQPHVAQLVASLLNDGGWDGVEDELQERRREEDARDLLRVDVLRDGLRVEDDAVGDDDSRRALAERTVHLPHEEHACAHAVLDLAGAGIAVVGVPGEAVAVGVHGAAVRLANALGRARGARAHYAEGQAVGVGSWEEGWLRRVLIRGGDPARLQQLLEAVQHDHGVVLHALLVLGAGDDQVGLGLRHGAVQQLLGVHQLQRHVGAAGLQDGHVGDDVLNAARQQDAHHRVRPHLVLLRVQPRGQGVRDSVQLAVGELPVALVNDRDGIGRLGRLLHEQVLQAQRVHVAPGGQVGDGDGRRPCRRRHHRHDG
mmetsp:Transcript_20830/g.59413  ORF Transcript_20830/g.59413 Transcript_20830/m.59413 type:complete len:560 (-) Transcript_20830:89-1768(-)